MRNWIYLGGEAALEKKDVVAIFDLDNTSWSIDTRRFLNMAEKRKQILNAAEDLPKAFAVCADGTVVLAQPNSAILAKRWENEQ